MKFAAPPGVFDVIPEDKKEPWHASHLWYHVEEVFRRTAISYGYQEVRTPIFERTELFERGVGETSDIVSKEMYTFIDKGDRSLTLRPEGTAPVMRAFIEHQLHQTSPIHKLFYFGPMFRYERSQAGRYRQFHQFGAEVIGIAQPEQDAELIDMAYAAYTALGMKGLKIFINSIGSTESRIRYQDALRHYFHNHASKLSQDSKNRLQANPLRILDSKSPEDQALITDAPSILDYLDDESRDHFDEVKKHLELLNIPYLINPRLVRGLDYYNKTVFEVVSEDLGSQNSVGGGGRFDGLLKTLGGPDLPCTGFATGLERVIQTLLIQSAPLPEPLHPTLYIIPLGKEASYACFKIMHELRKEGVYVQMDFTGRKLNKLMQYADQIKAKFVAVVGEEELKSETVELKEMATGEKTLAPLYHLSRILSVEESSEAFVNLWREMAKPFANTSEAEFFINRLNRSIEVTQTITKELQQAMESIQGYLDDKSGSRP